MIRQFGPEELFFILEATRWTVLLSLVAFVGGGAGGLVVAALRISDSKILRFLAVTFIRLIQGTPLLMQLFLIFFGATFFGFDVDPWIAASVGLTVNTSAFLGEIWRGAIQAVPRGQTEAAIALGLGYIHRMRFVVLPQAARLSYAPTVGFAVQLVKATSITAIVGFTELTRASQIINNATFRPFLVFGIAAAIYFALCWPLSILSNWLERRTAPASR